MTKASTVPTTHARPTRADRRQIRRDLGARTAAEAIGPLAPGCEIYGLTKGQFSLIDILEHCLAATGPADVTLSTWTAAGADMGFAHGLMRNGAIRTMRLIVDFSFPTRQPEYCAAMRERFGDDAIRITKTHAKFVVIRNDTWNIVIRSSMNLNENRRLESFEISDDAQMAAYILDLCRELFEDHAPGSQFAKTPYANCLDFERLGESVPVDVEASAAASGGLRFFNDAPLGQDLRRSGLTFTKTGKAI